MWRRGGKAVLTHFENGLVIYSHNQLYGRWFVTRTGTFPETGRQLRLAIHNAHYSASDIEVLTKEQLETHPVLARLGPDLLSERPDAQAIRQRLQLPRFRRRQLAGLLLDQVFVAGLGNYLHAEILTRSGLHPATKPADCSDRQLLELARQIIRLTRRSYDRRGIINPPALVRQLKQQGLVRRKQYRSNTYGRDGESCHFYGATIEISNLGGR